ncbi:MAG TPA: D-alanyl-D-alanine carboxypeptidase [Mycobacteriales bacterium]|nr:D-alanyl-D-alanine carboxypeptidase [Mycobacteriales bacterium]
MRVGNRRLDGLIAMGAVAVLSGGVLAAGITVTPTRAAAAVPPSVVRTSPLTAAALSQLLPSSSTSTIDSTLTSAIRERLSKATAAGYGVVVDIAGRGRVVSVHPDTRIRPASTQKLFTTLPLLLANPDRRLVTQIRAGGSMAGGVLHGNLVVRSSNDPSLLLRDLSALAQQVRDSGIHGVTGELRLDIGSLPMATTRSGWQPDSVPYDVGPISPFPVREDILSRSTTYLRHPTEGNLYVLRNRLAKAGVWIRGEDRIVRDSLAKRVVASHSSAPMSRLIRHTLLESDNLYAESLLNIEKRWRVNKLISDAGITDSYATDGSGLSYSDYETARGEVKLLKYAAKSPAADALVASLPVGCVSGTLIDRFCDTIGAGKVWAKTGTLRYNRALSGYTYDGLGRRVTFSILTYGVSNLTYAAHAIDRAVLVMRRYQG